MGCGSSHATAAAVAPVSPPQAASVASAPAAPAAAPPRSPPAAPPSAQRPPALTLDRLPSAPHVLPTPTPAPTPPLPASERVVAAAVAGGVAGVVSLMAATAGDAPSDAEVQWWAADSLAGLCAGNAPARADVARLGGDVLLLNAALRFPWVSAVQVKTNWLLAILAADSAASAALGAAGAVEVVLAGVQRHNTDYQVQVSGVRALQNLTANDASEANLARALLGGAPGALEAAIQRFADDGQLVYRASALLTRLRTTNAAHAENVAADDRRLSRGASSARLSSPAPAPRAEFVESARDGAWRRRAAGGRRARCRR